MHICYIIVSIQPYSCYVYMCMSYSMYRLAHQSRGLALVPHSCRTRAVQVRGRPQIIYAYRYASIAIITILLYTCVCVLLLVLSTLIGKQRRADISQLTYQVYISPYFTTVMVLCLLHVYIHAL